MTNLFGFRTARPVSPRKAAAPRFFRPRLEAMEARDVPAAAPALLGAPLVSSINITGVTNDVLNLVANITTPARQTLQVPLTLDNVAAPGSTPILDLHVNPIHLNVLGLKVDTSNICLDISAQSGPGNLLGNLLTDISHLLDQGLNIGQILSNLSLSQLTNLSNGLSGVVNGALRAIGSPTTAATPGVASVPTGTSILHLAVGPLDLNLLGLRVHLDDCNNGPVTVDISAQPGAGNLLGNLINGLAGLLDNPASPAGAIRAKINQIANDVRSLVAAAGRHLTSLVPLQVTGVDLTGGNTAGTLEAVANTSTLVNGTPFTIPLALTSAGTTAAGVPILNLHVGAIHLNLLGLTVDTSEICLNITAQPGAGNLLGNLLGNIAGLLNGGQTGAQILGGLTGTQLTTLINGLTGLLNGALGLIGSPTNAALGGSSVTTGTTNILHLSLAPVDLNLLGLDVHLDNCNNGPVTVDIGAEAGPGKLLGNLLGGLAHLLDTNASPLALLQQIGRIAGLLDRIL